MISTSDGVVHEMHVQWAERMQGTEKRQWWWESVWEEARVEDDRSEFQKPKRKMKNEREGEEREQKNLPPDPVVRTCGFQKPKRKKRKRKEKKEKEKGRGKDAGAKKFTTRCGRMPTCD
jgi:hypothetical protein